MFTIIVIHIWVSAQGYNEQEKQIVEKGQTKSIIKISKKKKKKREKNGKRKINEYFQRDENLPPLGI